MRGELSRMGTRALVLASLLPFAACCIPYTVQRCAELVAPIDGERLQHTLQSLEGCTTTYPKERGEVMLTFQRGEEHVDIWYGDTPEGRELALGSTWWGRLPDEACLRASLALQDELLRTFATTVPGFPPAAAFRREWYGLDNPRGAQWAELRARIEADGAP